MAKESTARKCSHCGNNGHNSRTCSGMGGCEKGGGGGEGLMLFGVRIGGGGGAAAGGGGEGEMMRKCRSMVNLASCAEQSSGDQGYLSDGLVHSSSNRRNERKRGLQFFFPFLSIIVWLFILMIFLGRPAGSFCGCLLDNGRCSAFVD